MAKRKTRSSRATDTVKRLAMAQAMSSGGGAITGPMAAAKLGSLAGEALYHGGSKLYSWLTGGGDYQLNSNSLLAAGGTSSEVIQISPAGERAIRVRYKEYLGDVFTHPTIAGAFYNTSYPINPGLQQTFPWLAQLAQQYEQWEPHGIVFEFKSTSSEYVSTQALGSVIMCTEYDVSDSAFTDKRDMLNSAYSNEAKPSSQILHGVECEPMERMLRTYFTRFGAVSSNIKDYDLGNFQIATQGGATTALNLGSLYVHYDISFRKEQVFGGIRNKGAYTARYQGTTGISTSNYWGTNVAITYDPFPLTLSANAILLPRWIQTGWWMFQYIVVGSSTACTYPTPTYTNCSNISSQVVGSWSGPGTTGTLVHTIVFAVNNPADQVQISLSGGVLPTSPTFAMFMLTNIGQFGN